MSATTIDPDDPNTFIIVDDPLISDNIISQEVKDKISDWFRTILSDRIVLERMIIVHDGISITDTDIVKYENK